MFCKFCGKEISEGSVFCMNCGKPVQDMVPPVQNMAPPVQNMASPVQNMAPPVQQHTTPAQSMKWFKFIVYFQLFFVAVIMLVNLVNSVTGLRYGTNASVVYLYYEELQVIDILYGILCLFFAGLAIFVQQWLIRYKSSAWVLYLFYVGVTNGVNLLYLLVTNIIIGQSIAHLVGNMVGVLIVPAIYIPLNYIYFNKRRHLFVN